MPQKEKRDIILSQKDGIAVLVKVVVKKLAESKHANAKIWLDFFNMYSDTFELLPGFDKAFIAGEKLENVLQLSIGELPAQAA